MRKVGAESQQSWKTKSKAPDKRTFFQKYMSGFGLDVGFSGYEEDIVPILDTAIGVDLDYPGYDGITLPFPDNSQNYVFSSHCLEHIEDYISVIQDWHRVVKIGGHIITVVPHKYLYEKKSSPPSNWNRDHKRFYTPATLIGEFEKALQPNSYRVRLLEDGDFGFDYSIPQEKHSGGQYEITLVIEKIKPPNWELEQSEEDLRIEHGIYG